ncbi:MAG: YggS family pyridoxal phosphate-dependent enzyme [Bryobacteraceae bacterium]
MLRERIDQVEERIQRACGRAGRKREEITLVAVTKKFSPQVMLEAYGCALRVFGENYVQEFERKRPELGSMTGAQFHFIGHLQSNKTRVAAEIFDVVETVDSEKIARRLDQAAGEMGRTLGVMLEVKLSGEESKAGVDVSELPALIEAVRSCPKLRLDGLMTMPPWSDDQEQTRPYFKKLAALAREQGLAKLSMGMSHDFEAAIEEGATHIRVGTALFGPRPKPTIVI